MDNPRKTPHQALRDAERAMRGMLSASFGQGDRGEFLEPIEVSPSDNTELNPLKLLERYYENASIDVGIGFDTPTTTILEPPTEPEFSFPESPFTATPPGLQFDAAETTLDQSREGQLGVDLPRFTPPASFVSTSFAGLPEPSDSPLPTVQAPAVISSSQSSEIAVGSVSSSAGPTAAPETGWPQTPLESPIRPVPNAPYRGERKMGERREQWKQDHQSDGRAPRVAISHDGILPLGPHFFNSDKQAESFQTHSDAVASEAIQDIEDVAMSTLTLFLQSLSRIVYAVRELADRVDDMSATLDAEGEDDHEFL